MTRIFKKGKITLYLMAILILLFGTIVLSKNAYAAETTIPTPTITNVSVGNSSLAYSDNDNELVIELKEIDDDYAMQYEVLYGTNNNPTNSLNITANQLIGTSTGTRVELKSDASLTSGTTYYFKIRRCHGSLKSDWSTVYTYNFVQVGKPVIKNVSVQYKQVYISYPYDYYNVPYLYVSWNAATNAEKYVVDIQRYNEERDTYTQCGYEYAISNTYCEIPKYVSDSSFKPNEKLYISVKAYSETKSSYSEASEKYEITMPNIVLDKIKFDNDHLSLKVGEAYYIEQTLSPYNATNRTVLWTSSNTDVATVSSYGQVTALSEGRTIITCSGLYGDAFAVCEVIVSANENSDETNSEVSTGSGKCGDNATWVLDENGVLTISGTGAIWSSNAYTGWDRDNLKNYIKEIKIEEGITEIGEYSFLWCNNLTSVKLPDSLTNIKKANFEGCGKLSEITIPKNVSNIDGNIFLNCTNLSKINVANGNQYFFAIDGILFNASTLTLVSYPKNKQETAYAVPNGIENIGTSAFQSVTNLKSVTLPSTLKTIGEVAFGYCRNLTECNIPNGVYNIAASAFNSTGLTELVLPSSLETLTINSFYGCNKLDYIVIPKSITNIDAAVFQKCDNITHVNYEGTQSEWNQIVIGADNDSLINATINLNSTHVHSGGFATCFARAVCEDCGNEYGAFAHSLSYYDYKSATCKEVGWQAYEKCSNCSYSTYEERPLSSHNIGKYGAYPATCEAEGNITYYKCSGCEQFFSDAMGENEISQADTIVPPLEHSYNKDSGLCIYCKKVQPGYCGENLTWELSETGVLTISGTGKMWNNFSWNRADIKEVIIHNGATDIRAKAFQNCSNLTSILIPDSVETIEKDSFSGCNSLETLTIPFVGGSRTDSKTLGFVFKSITTSYRGSSGAIIYQTTYYVPESLKKVTITDTASFTSYSFQDCEDIEVIVLPNMVTSIAANTFEDCTRLTDIYFMGTNAEWESLFQGETTATVHFTDVNVTGIILDKTSISLLKGESETLSATVLPTNATNKNVSWTSSDESIATVSNGVIHAKGVGFTTITATSADGKQTASCIVTVDYPTKITELDYEIIGTYALVTLSVDNMSDTATLYFATYGDNNKLSEVQTPKLTNGFTRIIFPVGNIHKIKAFVLESDLQPAAYCAEKPL